MSKDYLIFSSNSDGQQTFFGKPLDKFVIETTIENLKHIQFEISGTYRTNDKEYIIDEKFKIDTYLTNALVHENDIENELKSITKELKAINVTI